MQVFLAFRSDPRDPTTEDHVSIAVERNDLSLSPEDFTKRFLVPAWAVLKAKIEREEEGY